MKLLFSVILFLLAIPASITAQKAPVKFGKVSPADFETHVYSIDSNASAVVIADIGTTKIIGNTKNWFSLEFTHYKRVHILNKNGYDAADVSVYLYTNGEEEEKLDKLKAVTYNLENGKVVETKLDTKSGVYKDNINKNWLVRKFTFSNVKEGSIIEFEFTKISDFVDNLEPWEFQGAYPRLWSEYNFALPSFFNYVFIMQGYRSFDIKESKESRQAFNVIDNRGSGASNIVNFTTGVTDYRWVIKNVAPLKQENYTSTLKNHISKIEFQLTEQREPLNPRKYIETWQKWTSDLLKAENFGEQLGKDNGWMNDILDPVVRGATSPLEKARRIFSYVQNNYTCTNHSRFMMDQNLRNVARSRTGNVAEINLLLTAMLKHEKISTAPVMLSTRSHGFVYAGYPLPGKFNYVICKATIGEKEYLLDASQPMLGFGKPAYESFNGHARIIDESATPIDLSNDSLKETSVTSVILINGEKGNLSGSLQKTPGYYDSYNIRNKIREQGKEQFFADIKKGFVADIEITEPAIDSLTNYEEPLAIRYKFDIKTDKEDIYYFNPMLSEGLKENPFKSAERFYPVEMPYTIDQTYLFRMDVPQGYVTDEVPKQIVVKLNEEGNGIFEYRLSESNGVISLRSRLRINRARFIPEEYEMLREFFNLVVKKHSEQIVFKKKP